MPQETIKIKFKPQGSQSVVQAIKALNKAQQDLHKGQTSSARSSARAGAASVAMGRQIQGTGQRVNQLAKRGTGLSKVFSIMRSRMLLASFAMTLMVRPIVRLVQASAQLEDLTRGFTNLLGATENAAKGLERLKEATNNTMSEIDLLKQANNAMLLGVTKNTQEMGKMFDIAQRLGKALGRDTTSSVESLITGIGRQSRLMLDNIGIIVKADEAYKLYAARIGTTADKLTDAQKKQAFFEAAMASAEAKVQDLGPEVETTTDRLTQMSSSVENAKASIGDLFAPAVVSLADGVSSAASSITNFVDSLDFGTVKDFTDEVLRLGGGMQDVAIAEALKSIPTLTTQLTTVRGQWDSVRDSILDAADAGDSFDSPLKQQIVEQTDKIIEQIQKRKDVNDLLEYQDELNASLEHTQSELLKFTLEQARAEVQVFDAKTKIKDLEKESETANEKRLQEIRDEIALEKHKLTVAQNAQGVLISENAELSEREKMLIAIITNLETETGILTAMQIARDYIKKTVVDTLAVEIEAVQVIGKRLTFVAQETELWTKVKNRIKAIQREIAIVGMQHLENNAIVEQAIKLAELESNTIGKIEANKKEQLKIEEDIEKARTEGKRQEEENFKAVLKSLKLEAEEIKKLEEAYKSLLGTQTMRTLEDSAQEAIEELIDAQQKLEIAQLESKGFDALAKKTTMLNEKNSKNALLTKEITDLTEMQSTASEEQKKVIQEEIDAKKALIEINNEIFEQGKADVDNKVEMFEVEEQLHERRKEMAEEFKELMADTYAFGKDLMLEDVERSKDAEIKKLKARRKSAKNNIRNERKRAIELEKIDGQIEKVEKDAHNRAVDLKLKFVLADFALGLFKIWHGYVAGKANIMATVPAPAWPPLFGLALSNALADTALLTGTQALQYAQINATKMATGGLVGGKLHAQGGTLIEAERGEFVMQRDAVDTYGTEVMNRMNEGEGGVVTVNITGNVMSQDFLEDEAIPMIKESLRRGNILV